MTPAARPAAPVVVVGDVMVDVLVEVHDARAHGTDTDSRIATAPGGAGANQAAFLSAHGCDVRLAACVGDDPQGAAAREALRAAGVDVAAVAIVEGATGTVVALVEPDGERTMLTDRAANLLLEPSVVEAAARGLSASGHVHVSGYALLDARTRPAGVRALELATRAGATRSVDASSAGPLRQMGAAAFLALARGARFFFCNLEEGSVLTGLDEPRAIVGVLGGEFEEVVLTLGAEGALAASGDGVVHQRPAGTVATADTVGAGDALAAAYLAGRLGGLGPDEALATAVAAGTRAATTRGARRWTSYSRE